MRTAALLAFLSLSFVACATVQHGPVQRIHVETDPEGAIVRTENCGPGATREATTPADVWVSRRAKECAFTLAAPGYYVETVVLSRKVADEYFENLDLAGVLCGDDVIDCSDPSSWPFFLFFGGVLAGTGFGVDTVTGAMFEQEPAEVMVELQPVEEPQHR